jgi:tRNA threonylcarbamoyladenosine biosynthesis protein TsaE
MKNWKNVHEKNIDSIVKELKNVLPIPSVLILSGPVGAGKTTFVKRFIGEDSQCVSPTYSLINEFDDCVHADFYRIKSPDDIIHLEISLFLENKNYFIIEWGKNFLENIFNEVGADFNYYELEIEFTCNEKERNFLLKKLAILDS